MSPSTEALERSTTWAPRMEPLTRPNTLTVSAAIEPCDGCFLADLELLAVNVGLDVAEDLERAFAADGDGLALDRKIVADHGLRIGAAGVTAWSWRSMPAARSTRRICGAAVSLSDVGVGLDQAYG